MDDDVFRYGWDRAPGVEGIKKTILYGGTAEMPRFITGTKVAFPFCTQLCDDCKVIDDSKGLGFWCDVTVSRTHSPTITLASTLWWPHTRIAEGNDPVDWHIHSCGMVNMFANHTLGYDDLDQLQKKPQPLYFVLELGKYIYIFFPHLFGLRTSSHLQLRPGQDKAKQCDTNNNTELHME
uniref:Uncharacterized protein n=1 Tax=Oncorhynchus kisutch TaxID=8019 RepID=A0A8C7G9P5_ONCKI